LTKGLRIQARDIALLKDLYDHAALSRDQIIAFGHFASISRANSRLAKLVEYRLVRRYPIPAVGSLQSAYTIGANAADVLADHLDVPFEQLRLAASQDPAVLTLRHTLKIAEIGLAFRDQSKAHGLTVRQWLPERSCRHDYAEGSDTAGWHVQIIRPDAYLCLEDSCRRYSFFIEVDCGNVGAARFAKKIDGYLRYRAGVFQETYPDTTFKILVVTTGPMRASHLLDCAPRGSSVLLATTFDLLHSFGPLGKIWSDGVEAPEGPTHQKSLQERSC